MRFEHLPPPPGGRGVHLRFKRAVGAGILPLVIAAGTLLYLPAMPWDPAHAPSVTSTVFFLLAVLLVATSSFLWFNRTDLIATSDFIEVRGTPIPWPLPTRIARADVQWIEIEHLENAKYGKLEHQRKTTYSSRLVAVGQGKRFTLLSAPNEKAFATVAQLLEYAGYPRG